MTALGWHDIANALPPACACGAVGGLIASQIQPRLLFARQPALVPWLQAHWWITVLLGAATTGAAVPALLALTWGVPVTVGNTNAAPALVWIASVLGTGAAASLLLGATHWVLLRRWAVLPLHLLGISAGLWMLLWTGTWLVLGLVLLVPVLLFRMPIL